MNSCLITVLKKVEHLDLIEKYENPIKNHCDMQEGMSFVSTDAKIPQGFCESAWLNIYPYVFALTYGAKDFFNGWMKNENQAIISCNDGFRPVSFLIEKI